MNPRCPARGRSASGFIFLLTDLLTYITITTEHSTIAPTMLNPEKLEPVNTECPPIDVFDNELV
ncbi:unnamed protein product [Rhizoctonia solani]|uniref:Uncharacterized protein n=1 Tax=Rhizoctonia solani TaxID=456999 RepID=A0A8H3DTS2_9AGAM|nr:unnamed protein product [Rhizoctonia solani]